jgi:hypothetical protein
MNIRPRATFAMAIAATTVGVLLWAAQPALTAAQEPPIDKSGLDILCSKKGDVYSPAPKPGGLSSCVFADGDVMTCDTKTEKCTVKRDAKSQRGINADVMTLRMLKELNDKVDRLSAQVQALSAAKK